MQTSEIEPDQLRLLLSPAFVTIESVRLHNNPINGSSISVSAELEKLVNLFKDGFLTETEFSLAKNQLLGIDQNKSSSILPNSPCQPDNLGARFNLSDKKISLKSIGRNLFQNCLPRLGQRMAKNVLILKWRLKILFTKNL